jgi:hypothetical protein
MEQPVGVYLLDWLVNRSKVWKVQGRGNRRKPRLPAEPVRRYVAAV